MKNLKDDRTTILPSTTRGGKELPSSSALDSPSIISKLATPKPATAIRSDMSHVIDDATSAMHDTYDETTSMLDTTVPLGEFLDEQIARSREEKLLNLNTMMIVMMRTCMLFLKVIFLIENLLLLFSLARIDMSLRGY